MEKVSKKELQFALNEKKSELRKIRMDIFTHNPKITELVNEIKDIEELLDTLSEEN